MGSNKNAEGHTSPPIQILEYEGYSSQLLTTKVHQIKRAQVFFNNLKPKISLQSVKALSERKMEFKVVL